MPEINKIYLRNNKTTKKIFEVKHGNSFKTSELPTISDLNIEATTLDAVNKVNFTFNGKKNTEGVAPYCHPNDTSAAQFINGKNSLEIQADDGPITKIEFILIEDGVITPPPPVNETPTSNPFDQNTYQNNTEILLEGGREYDFTGKTVSLNGKNNITIRTVKQATSPAIIKYMNSSENKSAYAVNNTTNLKFENITFNFHKNNILTFSGAINTSFINCNVASNGGGIFQFLGNNDGILVEGGKTLGVYDGNIGYCGSSNPNKNVTIRGFISKYHSKGEHGFRFHNTFNLLVENCELDNKNSPYGKHPLNLRDGADFVVKNCKLDGPIVAGGLEDSNNTNKFLKNLTIENCVLNGYTILYSGISGLNIKNCTGTAYSSGSVFSVRNAYGNRPSATGTIQNCNMNYDPPQNAIFISGSTANINKIKLVDNKFNGSNVPNN